MRRLLRLLVVGGLVALAVLLGSPAWAAPAGGCAVPPEPDRPASGLVGLLDPMTGPGSDSVYGEVGYAGMTWRTYDVCARPDATAASTDTWVGSTLFNGAKVIVAAANGLHHQLDGRDQLGGLDALLHTGVGAMYRTVFTSWVGLALLVASIALLVLAARGDLARQAQRVGVAVVALTVAGLAYLAPVSLLTASDSVLLDGVSGMQQGFLAELGVGGQNTLPDTLTDQVVYANWLRGEFGSTDTPQARDLGRPLLRAQAFTRAEVAQGKDTAEVAATKKQAFTALTAKMGDRYAQFQGIAGSRVGTGGVALLQALTLAAFPAAAKLVVFVAMIILRLLVLFAPLIAVVAIMRPQILAGLFRLVAGVLTNAVLAGALAAAHAWLVVMMLRPGSGVAPLLTLVVAGVVSVLFWVLIRPVRRLTTLGSMVLPHPVARVRIADAPAPVAEPARPPLGPAVPTRPAMARPALSRPGQAEARSVFHRPRLAIEAAPTDRSSGGHPDLRPPVRIPVPLGVALPAQRGGGGAGADLDDRGRHLGVRGTRS